jgi:hypothetical protein
MTMRSERQVNSIVDIFKSVFLVIQLHQLHENMRAGGNGVRGKIL